MQKLAEICIQRPVFAAMIILSLVVVGAASYFRLGVDRFPSVDLPNVIAQIQASFGQECLPVNLPTGKSKAVVECLLNNAGEADFDAVIAHEEAISPSLGGRSVFDDKPRQQSLF